MTRLVGLLALNAIVVRVVVVLEAVAVLRKALEMAVEIRKALLSSENLRQHGMTG